MTEVPLRESSLKQDDAFVLDAGSVLYVFHGTGCNIREKTKAMQVAGEMRDGSGSKVGACPRSHTLISACPVACCGGRRCLHDAWRTPVHCPGAADAWPLISALAGCTWMHACLC